MFLLLLSYQNCIEPFLESVQCSFFERTSLEFVCYKKFIITVLCGENTPEYSRSCIVVVGHRVPFFGPLKNLFCLDIYIHYLWLNQKGLRSYRFMEFENSFYTFLAKTSVSKFLQEFRLVKSNGFRMDVVVGFT